MNKQKKVTKPSYIVDITKCEDGHDVLLAFAEAKQKAGFPITDEELNAMVDVNSTVVVIHDTCAYEVVKEKKPWYKRLWNWITRK